MSEYSLTIPYFVCREWGTQCVANCPPNDSACASECRQDHPCGALNPKRVATTASTMAPTASKTDDGTTIYTGSPGGSDDDDDDGDDKKNDDKGGAAAALGLGRSYGLAIVAGTMFIGFAML